MNIKVETHSHSLMSGHAYSTIKEMVEAAKAYGLEAVSLTEHAPDMPGSCGLYYFQNYKVVPREQEGIRLLLGVELNILDETGVVDMPEDVLAKQDIVVASIHTPCYRGALTREAITESYVNAMRNPYIHIIGHPDDSRFPIDYEVLVKAAKETNTLLEVNNSSLSPNSFRKGAEDNYVELLHYCKKYQVYVALGSDAHIDIDVGNTSNSVQMLEKCGFPEELVANTTWEKFHPFLIKS